MFRNLSIFLGGGGEYTLTFLDIYCSTCNTILNILLNQEI